MAFDSEESESARRFPWRRAGYGAVLIVALGAGLYFLATSSFFIQGVILPRIERNLDAQIEVEEISVSPFRWLRARGVSVVFEKPRTTFQTEALDIEANLFGLRSGDLRIQKLQLIDPVLRVTQRAGETESPQAPARGAPATDYSGLVRRLDIDEIAIENGSFQMDFEEGEDGKKSWEGDRINLQVNNLRSGGTGDLSVAGNIRYQQNDSSEPAEETPSEDRWSAQIDGEYEFALDRSSLPRSTEGRTVIRLSEAEGRFAEMQGLAAALNANLTPERLNALSIVFSKEDQRLGRVQLRGPMDLDRREARLNLDVSELDRRVLNLLVASRGWDFGSSQLNASGVLDFSRNGRFVVADFEIHGKDLTLLTGEASIQPFDLALDFQINGNLSEETLLLRRFNCELRQAEAPVLNAALDRPMNVSLGQTYPGFKESSFTVKWQDLNLAHWKPFLGEYLPAGSSQGTVTVTTQLDGQLIVFNGSARMNDFTALLPGQTLDQVQAAIQFNGLFEDFERFSMENYRYQVSRRNHPLLEGDGTVEYHRVFKDFRFRLTSNVQLPAMLEAYPFEPISASNGALKTSWTYFDTRAGREMTGNLIVENFTGELLGVRLADFHANLDSRFETHDGLLTIRDASLRTHQGLDEGGLIGLNGEIDLEDKSGQLGLRMVEVNEKLLNPLLHRFEQAFALNSIRVTGGWDTTWDSGFNTAFQGNVGVTNLTVAASNPFGFGVNLQGELTRGQLRVPSFQLTLPDTENVDNNQLNIRSVFDLTGTNTAVTNQIQIASERVDVTGAYRFLSLAALSETP